MPQSITIGLFVLGAILVLIAILGGNFKLFGAEVAANVSNPFLRLMAFVLGIVFIIAAISSNGEQPPQPPSQAMGSYCCDLAGVRRCPLITSLAVGAPCFCPYQGTGYTCQ